MKRVAYISGPMTGLPDNNYPAFDRVAAYLRARGYQVESPAEATPPTCGTWLGWMRGAICKMMKCDIVVMLPEWGASRGATIERQLAIDLGIEVVTLAELTD